VTAIVQRPDLTARKTLNKSILGDFGRCQTKTWYSLHDPKPFIPKEVVTFGSAIDAAVEVIVKLVASGQPADLGRATAAAVEVIDRDDAKAEDLGVPATGVDIIEVQSALATFAASVLPVMTFDRAITQHSIRATIEGLGEAEGHPDILIPVADGDEVWDVKATVGKRAKEARSLELAFYAILREAETGRPVTRVGYIEYRRGAPNGALVKPQWLTPSTAITPELRRWAYEQAAAFVRAKRADALLNAKAAEPVNWSMTGGPSFSGLCNDCPWNPALGGPCAIAVREEEAA
jgi:hypothetical protein